MVGVVVRFALDATCLRGALPPVDLRAVCLVRATVQEERKRKRKKEREEKKKRSQLVSHNTLPPVVWHMSRPNTMRSRFPQNGQEKLKAHLFVSLSPVYNWIDANSSPGGI
jgi:hypothetical protein